MIKQEASNKHGFVPQKDPQSFHTDRQHLFDNHQEKPRSRNALQKQQDLHKSRTQLQDPSPQDMFRMDNHSAIVTAKNSQMAHVPANLFLSQVDPNYVKRQQTQQMTHHSQTSTNSHLISNSMHRNPNYTNYTEQVPQSIPALQNYYMTGGFQPDPYARDPYTNINISNTTGSGYSQPSQHSYSGTSAPDANPYYQNVHP